MNQQGFVKLAIVAFGLVILSFFVLGFSRTVFDFRTAQLLAAPIGFAGFGLAIFLFVRATLSAAGVWTIDPE